MEIYHFDRERFDGLKELICVGEAPAFRLWTLPADSLRLHPHIRSWQTARPLVLYTETTAKEALTPAGLRQAGTSSAARAIVLYRENNAKEALTLAGLREAGILSEEQAEGLGRCRIAPPR